MRGEDFAVARWAHLSGAAARAKQTMHHIPFLTCVTVCVGPVRVPSALPLYIVVHR